MSAIDPAVSLERAQALIDLGRFQEAASHIRPVLSADPANADAACLLAQAELIAGNDLPAFDAAALAVKLAPERAWAHRLMAMGYERFDNNEYEIRHSLEAVRLEPHDPNGYICLARALAREKADLAAAREAAEEALRLAPVEPEAHLTLATVCEQQGDRDGAEAALRRALAVDPEHSAAHNNLARIRLRRRGTTLKPALLAIGARGFATAVRTNPSSPTSRLNLDYVIRVFLDWTAYLIFADAFFCAWGGAGSTKSIARLLPIAVLALPFLYALRFLARVGPQLRAHVVRTVRFDPRVRLPAALLAFASIFIVAGAIAAQSARPALAAAAAIGAMAAELALHRQVEAAGSRAQGEAITPVLGTPTLWIITAGLALTAGFLGLAYANEAHETSVLIAALIVGATAIAVAAHATRRHRN